MSQRPTPVMTIDEAYGRLTAPARMTPSFLICGGQRCGTTSLYRALAAHPVLAADRSGPGACDGPPLA